MAMENQQTNMTSQDYNRVIQEAIKLIVLGRAKERIDMSPSGTEGIGTARMTHGYVVKIHYDPADEEYEDYKGTIDVREYPDETASNEPLTHKGVMLSGLQDNANGVLIIPTLYSDVTIISDAASKYSYVINYSHAKIVQFDSHEETTIGVTETEEMDPDDNDSPDYDELEKTGNASSTKYKADSINTTVKSKDGKQSEVHITSTGITQKVDKSIVSQGPDNVAMVVEGNGIKVTVNKITIVGEDATEPLVLGNQLAQLMMDFLTECSKIMTPTLMGTMPAINASMFSTLTPKIQAFLSKTAYTK